MHCAMLKEAIGKAPCRRTYIKAGAAGNRYGPVLECARELEAAAAYVGRIVAKQPYGRVLLHQRARLIDLLLADQNAAGKDHGARAFAAGDQAVLDEQNIYAHFYWSRRQCTTYT
jgi:hypothetical protein